MSKDGGANYMNGASFRFRNDDGDNTDGTTDNPQDFLGTWIAAKFTNVNMYLDQPQFRLRYGIRKLEGSLSTYTINYAYSYDGAAYTIITPSSSCVRNVSTVHASNNEHTYGYSGTDEITGNTWADATNNQYISDDAQGNSGQCTWDATSGYVGVDSEICLELQPDDLAVGKTLIIIPYIYSMIAFSEGWNWYPTITFIAGSYYKQPHPVYAVMNRQRTGSRIYSR